jgi:DMSO reductase anchor subunit
MNQINSQFLKLIIPLVLAQLILMIFCLVVLKRDPVNYLPKWLWAIIIIFGELLGPIIFLIFGRKKD